MASIDKTLEQLRPAILAGDLLALVEALELGRWIPRGGEYRDARSGRDYDTTDSTIQTWLLDHVINLVCSLADGKPEPVKRSGRHARVSRAVESLREDRKIAAEVLEHRKQGVSLSEAFRRTSKDTRGNESDIEAIRKAYYRALKRRGFPVSAVIHADRRKQGKKP